MQNHKSRYPDAEENSPDKDAQFWSLVQSLEYEKGKRIKDDKNEEKGAGQEESVNSRVGKPVQVQVDILH